MCALFASTVACNLEQDLVHFFKNLKNIEGNISVFCSVICITTCIIPYFGKVSLEKIKVQCLNIFAYDLDYNLY